MAQTTLVTLLFFVLLTAALTAAMVRYLYAHHMVVRWDPPAQMAECPACDGWGVVKIGGGLLPSGKLAAVMYARRAANVVNCAQCAGLGYVAAPPASLPGAADDL